MPDAIEELVFACMDENPDMRPGAEEIMDVLNPIVQAQAAAMRKKALGLPVRVPAGDRNRDAAATARRQWCSRGGCAT